MFHVYEIATGRLISSTKTPVTPKDGHAVKELPDDVVGVWNNETLTMDARPVVLRISKQQFVESFTHAELVKLFQLEKTDINVEVFLRKLALLEYVELTSAGIRNVLTYMVNAGVITSSRAQEIGGV